MTFTRCLPLAAAFLLTAGTALAEDATDAQVRNVEVHKFVVAQGEDAELPKTGVFVKRIQTNGQAPSTFLQLMGSDAQAIDLDDIEDGETRSFEIGDGKWMDVTRTGEQLELDIDGKEITVPLNPGAGAGLPGLHALTGSCDKNMRVMMLSGDELPENLEGLDGSHGMIFIGEDGLPQHLDGDANIEWVEDGNVSVGSMAKVIVKRIGEDGGETEDVHLMAMPAFPLHGLGGHAPDLAALETLKDADPEVREKVIAALKEILGQHHSITLDVNAGGADGRLQKIKVRRAAPNESVEVH